MGDRPSDDEIRVTGVRFTVLELNEMADAWERGKTPPALSYNESVLLAALIRQRVEKRVVAQGHAEAERLTRELDLPPGVRVEFDAAGVDGEPTP